MSKRTKYNTLSSSNDRLDRDNYIKKLISEGFSNDDIFLKVSKKYPVKLSTLRYLTTKIKNELENTDKITNPIYHLRFIVYYNGFNYNSLYNKLTEIVNKVKIEGYEIIASQNSIGFYDTIYIEILGKELVMMYHQIKIEHIKNGNHGIESIGITNIDFSLVDTSKSDSVEDLVLTKIKSII